MLRYMLLNAAVAAVLVAGCKPATMEKQGEVTPATAPAPVSATPAPAPVAQIPPQAPLAPAGERTGVDAARGYEIWKLVAQVPQAAFDRARGQAGCPQTFLMALFGVDFSNPHGCIIGKMMDDGAAKAAGLHVGDSIVACNGREVSCPMSLEPLVRESFNGPTPGRLTMTIHRPMAAAGTK